MSDRYSEYSTTAFADCIQTRELDSSYFQIVEMDPSGRYIKYNEILGKGAVKTVYRAFDRLDGIEVAWNQAKLEDLLRNPENLERFYAEVHLLKSLKHKNIIKFYNSWVDTRHRNINFITEIFTSGTLRQYREKHKHVDLKAVKYWARQILRGLLYLHSHDPPIIHRDLKCDNIFINGNVGEVKIGDFGLAAILCQSARSVLGTPEFMAPELYEEDYDELVDIYSFGMCLLEMITSEYPYSECTNAAQIYKKVTAGKRPAALERVKDPSARNFIERCLERANNRPPARELLMDPFLVCADLETNECMRSIIQSDIKRSDVDVGVADWEGPCYDTTSAEDSLSSSLDPRANAAVGNNVLEGCRPGVAVSSLAPSTLDGVRRRLSDDSCDSWTVAGPVDLNPFSSSLSSETEPSRSNVIMLGLRIVNPEGQIRSIRFPFDVQGDTALTVASEMVHELNLPDQDISLVAELIDSEVKAVNPNWKTEPAFDDLMVGVPSLEEEFMDQSKLGAVYRTAKFSPSTSLTSKVPPLEPVSTKQNSCLISTKDNVALSSSRPECTMHGRFEEIECPLNCTHHGLRRTDEQIHVPCRRSETQVRLDLTEETSFTISSRFNSPCSSVDQHEDISSVMDTKKDVIYPVSPAEKSDGYNWHIMTEAEHNKYTGKSSRVFDDEYVEMPPTDIHGGCCKNFKILTEHVRCYSEQLKSASLYREMTSSSENKDASLLFASELKLLARAYEEELRALQMRHEHALLQLKSRYQHGRRSFESPISFCSDHQQANGAMCATLQDSAYLAPSADSNDADTSTSEKNVELGCEATRVKTLNGDYSNFVEDYRLPDCGRENCHTPMFSEKIILPGHRSQRRSTLNNWNISPRFNMIWRELNTVDRQDGLEQGNCNSQLDESIASVGLLMGQTGLDCSENLSEPFVPHPCENRTEKGLLCDAGRPQTTANCTPDTVCQGIIQANATNMHGNEKYEVEMESKPAEFLLNTATLGKGLQHETAEKVFPSDFSEIKCSHVMKSSPHRRVYAHYQEESEISYREASLLGKERENDTPGDALQTRRHSSYEDGGRGVLSSLRSSDEVEANDELKKEQLRRCIAELETKTLEGLCHSKMASWPAINCYKNR